MLSTDPQLTIVGAVNGPVAAERKLRETNPDVVLLNPEMERTNGLEFFKNLSRATTKPFVIVAGSSVQERENAILALEFGAVEIIQKPTAISFENFQEVTAEVSAAIKAAAGAMLNPKSLVNPETQRPYPLLHIGEAKIAKRFILLGGSIGFPALLLKIFTSVKRNIPGCVVVVHMPALFTKSLADRLNALSPLEIREARNGDHIKDNQVLIIPGDCTGKIKKDSLGFFVHVSPKLSKDNQPIDVLFSSAAEYVNSDMIAILASGLGDDGSRGLLTLKKRGATTIAQSVGTCRVAAMSKKAIDLEAAQMVCTPEEIIDYINEKET